MILFLLPAAALAADAGSSRTVSIGAGISSPSRTSALLENPAGLTLNEATRVQGALFSGNDSFDPLGFSGGIYFGNGSAGGAAEIARTGTDQTRLDLGLAAQISSLALGAHVRTDLGDGGGWGADIGAIFNPKNKLRFGALLYGVTGGIDGFGAGIASSVSSEATFALDAATDGDGNGLTLKPTLGVDLNTVQLVFGYGLELEESGGSPIPEGVALGLGLRLSQSAHLVGYYNQLDRYYFGVIFKL
ncbi:MAG TPA: hypothetical protein VM598_04340 [Bdellovibrionota bacterium]|nr:hypothetical protein [Bdellovibrionota bacterium]